MIDEIYSDLILELNKNPLNKKRISGISYRDKNPLCGDEIEIALEVNDSGEVVDVGFQGQGCAISQAAASIVTEMVKGRNIHELVKIEIDDVLNKLGVPQLKNNPVRIKCVALSVKAVKMAGFIYLSRER